MKRHHFKLDLKKAGEHIRCTVFSGNEGETLANCGVLTFRVGEWQLFGTLMSLGYSSPSSIRQHLHFSIIGEKEALI